MTIQKKKAKSKAGRPLKRESGSVREDLILAGIELLKSASLEDFSLRKVASTAGVSHVATYHHFKNKNALLAAIAEKGFEEYFAAYQKELQKTTNNFEGRFLSLGWTYIQFMINNQQYARIMFGGAGLDFKNYPELMSVSRRTYRQLYEIIRMGQKQGEIKIGSTREKILSSWAMIHGVAMLIIEGRLKIGKNPQKAEKLIRSITNYVYIGMKVK